MRFILALLFGLFTLPALAQDVTIKQSDLQELNTILQEQIPLKWAQPVIKWANGVMQKSVEEKVAGPKPDEKKPEEEKKPEPKQP